MPGTLKMILAKGRIEPKILRLLSSVGIEFAAADRSYRPACSDRRIEAKFLKPQNIPQLVALGRHDCGFSGRDWISEQGADVVELLDLGTDPVRIVSAVPEELAGNRAYLGRPIVVASEYRNIAARYIAERGLDAVYVQAHGATEALPPEDADMIIDNTATGSTLQLNRLVEVDELMTSTTRFFASREAMEDGGKRRILEELVMLMRGTLQAQNRVLLEMNVSVADFPSLVSGLPCMRAPTVSPLHDNAGFAIKIAVPLCDVPAIIPMLVARGARDILEYKLNKIVA